jgi:integrase/recombinase XerC
MDSSDPGLTYSSPIVKAKAVEVGPHPSRVHDGVTRSYLPPGMVLLYSRSGDPLTIANRFLLSHTSGSATDFHRWRNTNRSYSDDLVSWGTYLYYQGIPWELAGWQDIKDYRTLLDTGISVETRAPYEPTTVRRRVGTVLETYRFAYLHGLVAQKVVPDDPEEVRKVLPDAEAQNDARGMSLKQFRAILDRLGPELPQHWISSSPSSTKRLATEVAIITAMRLCELVSLTVADVLWLEAQLDEVDPDKLIVFAVSRTKGRPSREVVFPSRLVRMLVRYLLGERATTVHEAVHIHGISPHRVTDKLFINGLRCNRRDMAQAMSQDVLSRSFAKVILDLDYTYPVKEVVLDDKGSAVIVGGARQYRWVKRNLFVFHHLRHTFTEFHVDQLGKGGDRDPWKTLQLLLGHRWVGTTQNVYGRRARMREADISDSIAAQMDQIDSRYGVSTP